jgi:two-component system response regulator AtoC
MEKILIVEDVASLREVLKNVLDAEGYKVVACESAEEGLLAFPTEKFSLILSDFKLPKMNGIEFLTAIRREDADVPFLLMTAFGSIEVAVEAMKHGANDYVSKPFEPSYLVSLIRDLMKHRRVIDRRVSHNARREREFITQDPAVLKILEQARKVAVHDSSVLILGESGTGKELLARYIHEHSQQSNEEFVSVNCAALPPGLLESEFFGHEAGAFTGATQNRIGLLEFASNGTIFLDEIGDMPANLQVKLLRAFQEHEIKKVGSNRYIKVNPRIIAATNVDLEESVAAGKLREDFYYRLAVVTFRLPPLRERKCDVPVLIEYFLRQFSDQAGKAPPKMDELARDTLLAYRWPGNARELENVMERAVVLADDIIRLEHLGINLNFDLEAIESVASTLPEIVSRATRKTEIDTIIKALGHTHGNKSRAAEMLGVSYKTLLNKIKEYRLSEMA